MCYGWVWLSLLSRSIGAEQLRVEKRLLENACASVLCHVPIMCVFVLFCVNCLTLMHLKLFVINVLKM